MSQLRTGGPQGDHKFCEKLPETLSSLIAQLLKDLPPRQENPVRFLGWEDPLEKG